ncbi:class I tRNA ligase family protein [Streptacidiphilus sp. PAMC 29251]
MSAAESRTIIISATPTPNGDLHVGHLAGPYLAGDVYARYLRANGRSVVYTTCTDDSQSYVVTTAKRRGTTPEQLTANSTAAIARSLELMGISMAGLPPIDERYRRTVLDFLTRLHQADRFQLKTVTLPYAKRSGTFLFDGFVGGICPVCLSGSRGGACEDCGHPTSYDDLLEPYSTMDPTDPVVLREVEILVLPMEEYREQLTSYFKERQDRWRPHAMQLIRELLARPLPDIPVTVPGDWGIPAPFPEVSGQIVYPWIEAMPASILSTAWAVEQAEGTAPAAEPDTHWRAEHGAELVYFHGFDNVYHWGLMDLTFLLAHGNRYITPYTSVCNEFYDLDGEKFSTSRGHLITAAELMAEVPQDIARFYLALTAPEFQRSNFTLAELRSVTARRLIEPWGVLSDALSRATRGLDRDALLPTSQGGRDRAAALVERFRLCYELSDCSLVRAAETIGRQLERLRDSAVAVAANRDRTGLADLLLEVRTLLAGAAPILTEVTDRARSAGVDLALGAGAPTAIAPFALPRLTVASG